MEVISYLLTCYSVNICYSKVFFFLGDDIKAELGPHFARYNANSNAPNRVSITGKWGMLL